MTEHVTLSHKELDRLQIMSRIFERRMSQRSAGELLSLTERQVRRLYRAFKAHGAAGLVSGRRGKPSQRQLPQETRGRALELVREHYGDFGPTLAHEKLNEKLFPPLLTQSTVSSGTQKSPSMRQHSEAEAEAARIPGRSSVAIRSRRRGLRTSMDSLTSPGAGRSTASFGEWG